MKTTRCIGLAIMFAFQFAIFNCVPSDDNLPPDDDFVENVGEAEQPYTAGPYITYAGKACNPVAGFNSPFQMGMLCLVAAPNPNWQQPFWGPQHWDFWISSLGPVNVAPSGQAWALKWVNGQGTSYGMLANANPAPFSSGGVSTKALIDLEGNGAEFTGIPCGTSFLYAIAEGGRTSGMLEFRNTCSN